jgi:hypothetical protein
MLSGGADSVVNIWDLESEGSGRQVSVIDTLATIPQSVCLVPLLK